MELLGAGGVWLGLLIGIPAGMAFQHARQTVRNYRTTKAGLSGQKQAASSAETNGALWILVVVGVVTFLAVMLAKAG